MLIQDVTRCAIINKVYERNIIDLFENLNYQESLKLYYKLYPKNVKKLSQASNKRTR